MSKSRSKNAELISREEQRRAKAFKKWKINWPKTIFALIVLGSLAAAAIWQKSRDPARNTQELETAGAKKSVEEIDSLTELESLATEAERRLADNSATYAGKVAILEQLAAACRRMQELAKGKDESELLNYQSKELLARYFKLVTCAEAGLEDLQEREEVIRLVDQLKEVEDADVRYHVNLARLVLDGSALLLHPASEPEFVSLISVVKDVVANNPGDTRLAALNKRLIDEFKQEKQFPSERLSELVRTIVEAYSATDNLAIQTWTRQLNDEQLFEEYHYRDLLIRCELNSPGAYEAYLQALPKILEGKPTPLGYARLLSAANSFERVNRTREAGEVYRLVGESIPQPAADELAEVSRGCESGLLRLAKIGKPIEFSGTDVQGKRFELADFLGKPSVIAFCSAQDPEFASQVDKLKIDLRSFVRRGVNVVLVCLDASAEELQREFSEGDFKVFRVVADPQRNGELWKQTPAEVLPLVVLVNSVGQVQRYANLDVHLMTTIDGELSKGGSN